VWSALVAAAGLWWATGGGGYPFGDTVADDLGNLAAVVPATTTGVLLVVAGVAGVIIAALLRWGPGTGWPVRLLPKLGTLLAVAVALLVTDARLLSALAYTLVIPVLATMDSTIWGIYAAAVLNVPIMIQVMAVTGVLIWTMASISAARRSRAGCGNCGRDATQDEAVWLAQRGRARHWCKWATATGIFFALLYPLNRIPWLFGIRMGTGEETFARLSANPAGLVTGVALGSAAIAGAVLMLGLVQRWGVVFPRWTVGLAGRRVPVSLAVIPAAVAAAALVIGGRGTVALALELGVSMRPDAVMYGPLGMASMAGFLPWGVALAVAAAAYYYRRRGLCRMCGRGVPEAIA
jgi:hypothetical protein